MRLLIVNQHMLNHGDEAAGQAFLNELDEKTDIRQIGILYNTRKMPEGNKLDIRTEKHITHYTKPAISCFGRALVILSFLLPLHLVRILIKISSLKQEFGLIEDADIVISAPGGVNIGPYKDWRYLWRLYIAVKLHKPLAIYSISFGPIPKNKLFRFTSVYVLRNSQFLSLRDRQSQEYANEYRLKYTPSIDTVFLNNTFAKGLPAEFNNLKQKRYVVVVPNKLYSWHPSYKNIKAASLNKIYIDIINFFTCKGLNVVLLPQLFRNQKDMRYFEKLRQQSTSKENVRVISDKYNHDIQQNIVNNAQFLVGARYHSIIFAIRGETPFIALSYEHKIKQMLSLLSLDEYVFEMSQILLKKSHRELIEKIEMCFDNKLTIKEELHHAKNKACDIATETFSTFERFLEYVL